MACMDVTDGRANANIIDKLAVGAKSPEALLGTDQTSVGRPARAVTHTYSTVYRKDGSHLYLATRCRELKIIALIRTRVIYYATALCEPLRRDENNDIKFGLYFFL